MTLKRVEEGIVRSAYLYVESEASNTYASKVFRRNLYVYSRLLTHSDYSLSVSWYGGQFKEFTDSVFGVSFGARASDQFNNVRFSYTWGEEGVRISIALAAMLIYALTASLLGCPPKSNGILKGTINRF